MKPYHEHGSFREEGSALLNNILNRWLFSLWQPLALFRFFFLGSLFLVIWHYIANRYQPLPFWYYISLAPDFMTDPISIRGYLSNFIRHFFNLYTLRDMTPLLIPFLVMRFRAGAYLDDIFELDDIDVAIRFTDSAAFGLRYDTIEIENGEVHRASRNSPILRIGGPGFVRLSLDSAALFEYADGRPHTLLPKDQIDLSSWRFWTKKRRLSLDGFERLRATFNLRDHVIPFNVEGRTLDGIRIEARDVRLIFSLWRCGRTPSMDEPYPASRGALISLTYNQTAPVGQPGPRTLGDVQWRRRMSIMISSQLRDFISHTPLDEFIASAGEGLFGEDDEPFFTEEEGALSTGRHRRPARRREISGRITPRQDLPNYFLLFSQNFNAQAAHRGMEMRWNGIGAWVFPDEAINRRNLEAWRISRQNIIRTSHEGLQLHREEHALRTMRDLIRNYFLQPYREFKEAGKPRWRKMLHRLIIFFRQEINSNSSSIQEAEKNLQHARAHFVRRTSAPFPGVANDRIGQHFPDEQEGPPEGRETTPPAVPEAETPPQVREEIRRLRQMLEEQIGARALETALRKLQQTSAVPLAEPQMLARLARCVGEILQDAEMRGETLSAYVVAHRLYSRIANQNC